MRSTGVATGLLALLALIFYAPVLAGIRTFPDGDFSHHFLPFAEFMVETWRTLAAPVWNPYTYSGHPFWADVQAAVLYPVSNLLLVATLPFESPGARLYFLEVEAVIHVLLGGMFTYVLARELTHRQWPSVLAGISFMLSGYLTGYPPLQLAVLRTAVWLPLVLWLLLRAWQEPQRWRYWLGFSAALTASFLAGHSQTWMYLAYAAAGWVAVLAYGVRGPDSLPRRGAALARGAGLAVSAAVAAGFVAVQLLPSIEFVRLTVRSDVAYAYVSGGFPVRDTWQVLLPGVLTHYSPLYVGVVALGMAMLGVAVGLNRTSREWVSDTVPALSARFRRAAIVYFCALAVLGLLASYGNNGFLYPLLYRVAPGWDTFRGQERAAYLVAFGLSMLAAYGLAGAAETSHRFRRRFALVYGALVTAGVYAFGLLWQLPGNTDVGQWYFLLVAAFTLVFAMSLAVTVSLEGWSTRREWLICGLAAVNLLLANANTNLENRSPAEAAALPEEASALRAAVGELADVTGLDGRAYNEFRVYEDYGMRSRIEDVWGSSPLRLSNYSALFETFPLDRMFRLTGVGHVLTWRRELFEPSELLAEFPKQEDTTYLHRLAEPNPRLWIVGNAVSADDHSAAELLADHEFDLEQYVVIPAEYGLASWGGGPGGGRVQAERERPNRLGVRATDADGGILVVSENWMPGWRIDDVRCAPGVACAPNAEHESGLALLQPVRANLSFLAIALPAGDVEFTLTYAPRSIRVGTIVSGTTLLLVAAAFVVRSANRRREHAG